jgi:soluble cytochrome b562
MRHSWWICFLLLGFLPANILCAQTADDVSALINRLVELDSIDVAKEVKYRAGLLPTLHELEADEAEMKVLADPYAAQQSNTPGGVGWYRVSFVVPEKIGKFPLPAGGFNLGIESNVRGAWEIYTYKNDKPAGAAMIPTVTGTWNKGNILANSNQPATAWMSNAPMPTKPGDRVTVAILAMSTPLGQGNPDGFALRHLRLRYALYHTGARAPFYAALHKVHDKLQTLHGDELQAYQTKVKEPLAQLDKLFQAAESGKLDDLTKAMQAATKELNETLK